MRTKFSSRFLDDDDREMLKYPNRQNINENFSYHSLMMECVRRNPYTFEKRNPNLVPVLIEKEKLIFLTI